MPAWCSVLCWGIAAADGLAKRFQTIKAILVEKAPRAAVDPDGWTIRTVDGGWAARCEHTVVVTRGGAGILSAL